jgi:hypothetical protein
MVLMATPPPATAAEPPTTTPTREPGAAQALSTGGNTALTQVAAAGDNVHVVYQDRTVRPGGMSTVVHRLSENGGRTFATRKIISSLFGGDSLTPVVAARADDVYIAWKATTSKDDPSLGNAEIFVAVSRDKGRSFGQPQKLDADTADSMNPVVVTDGISAHVAWSDLDGRVMLARSNDHGLTWSPARQLGRGYGASVDIAQDGAHLAVAWANGGVVQVADSTDRGATFGPARTVAPANGYDPEVAVVGVSTIVAWGDWTEKTVRTASGTAGGGYGAPSSLPPTGHTWVSSLVADDRGHLLLTVQSNGVSEKGASVWSSTDTGSTWTMTTFRPTATGANATVLRAEDEHPEARLTYTVPERFKDHDGDGVLDERQSPADVHPTAYSVTFVRSSRDGRPRRC